MTELNTITLARLYAAQGALERSLRVYDSLLASEASNMQLTAERAEIARRIAAGEGRGPDSVRENHLESQIKLLQTWLDRLAERPGGRRGV